MGTSLHLEKTFPGRQLLRDVRGLRLLIEAVARSVPLVVIIDDYQSCYGCEKAVDELIAERGVRAPFIRLAKEGDLLAKDCYLGPAGFGAEIIGSYISPFQSSGSGLADRNTSRCHLPPPHGSMTSVATTSTRISAKVRPSGSPSR